MVTGPISDLDKVAVVESVIPPSDTVYMQDPHKMAAAAEWVSLLLSPYPILQASHRFEPLVYYLHH